MDPILQKLVSRCNTNGFVASDFDDVENAPEDNVTRTVKRASAKELALLKELIDNARNKS